MSDVLVIDDEPDIPVAFVRAAFAGSDLDVRVARTATEGLALFRARRPRAVLLDVQLPDGTGLEVFAQLRGLDARVPVVFATGSATTETAIEAMSQGAFEYLFKPLDLEQLRQVLGRALEVGRLMQIPAVVGEDPPTGGRADAILGTSHAMREVYKAIGRAAVQNVTVLVTGESGTGKELVARAIYQHSKRADKPFRAINCAAIPESLLESELFGHEKGAFTGADRKRIGKFEQCHGGTLFLDEVGEISPATQSKLLRVLQEQTFERVGGDETVRTDVRLIAATNRDLKSLAARGDYRPDLFYRLSVFTIQLPPLRDRPGDLPVLARHYVTRYGREMGKEVRTVSSAALEVLSRHPWPGNVRELQSVIRQAFLNANGPVLLPDFLPEALRHTPAALGPDTAGPAPDGPSPLVTFIRSRLSAGSRRIYEETVEHVERVLLPLVLEQTGGNQLRAAALLGVTRRTLRNKLRELGLTVTRTVDETGGADD